MLNSFVCLWLSLMCLCFKLLLIESKSSDKLNSSDIPYAEYYKYSYKTLQRAQEDRRQNYLEKMRKSRHDSVDKRRNIIDVQDLFKNGSSYVECMEVDDKCKKQKESERCRIERDLRKVGFTLSKAEWFLHIPQLEKLNAEWLVKVCPKGYRNLLVAKNFTTAVYTDRGTYLYDFKSNFPGGRCNPDDQELKRHWITVLDCVYEKSTKTFFVFDVLAWKSVSYIECTAAHRFHWLRMKFTEFPRLQESASGGLKFRLVEDIPAHPLKMQEYICQDLIIDGKFIWYSCVLFYHREGCYLIDKDNPLTCWLKIFMMPEAFEMKIPERYRSWIPKNYTNRWDYMLKYNMRKAALKKAQKMNNDEKLNNEEIEMEVICEGVSSLQ